MARALTPGAGSSNRFQCNGFFSIQAQTPPTHTHTHTRRHTHMNTLSLDKLTMSYMARPCLLEINIVLFCFLHHLFHVHTFVPWPFTTCHVSDPSLAQLKEPHLPQNTRSAAAACNKNWPKHTSSNLFIAS